MNRSRENWPWRGADSVMEARDGWGMGWIFVASARARNGAAEGRAVSGVGIPSSDSISG